MHGAGHVLACQLVHSGRFKEGAARRIGEMTEQLWALFKVCASTHWLCFLTTLYKHVCYGGALLNMV